MYTAPNDDRSLWLRRAQKTGLLMHNNKYVTDMTDEEIQAAFEDLSLSGRFGTVSYIWGSDI